MLKDITLGQFFPGDTVAHRLDPRTKILLVVLYIVALFCAKSLLAYGILAAVLGSVAAYAVILLGMKNPLVLEYLEKAKQKFRKTS